MTSTPNSTTPTRKIVEDIITSFNIKGKISGTGNDLNALEDSIVKALATKSAERENRIEEAVRTVEGWKSAYQNENTELIMSKLAKKMAIELCDSFLALLTSASNGAKPA